MAATQNTKCAELIAEERAHFNQSAEQFFRFKVSIREAKPEQLNAFEARLVAKVAEAEKALADAIRYRPSYAPKGQKTTSEWQAEGSIPIAKRDLLFFQLARTHAGC